MLNLNYLSNKLYFKDVFRMVPVLCAKEQRDLLKLKYDTANDFVNEIKRKSSKALTFETRFFALAIQTETLNLSFNISYVSSSNNIQVTYHDSLQPWGGEASLPKEQ